MFDAIIYDPVNNVLEGEVHWSASNGSISDDGMFTLGLQVWLKSPLNTTVWSQPTT